MMNKAIRTQLSSNPALEKLLPHIKGNVGLVFSKEDPVLVRDKLLENKVCSLTTEIIVLILSVREVVFAAQAVNNQYLSLGHIPLF